jgi:hypothetical protein
MISAKKKINHAGGYFKKINAVIDGKIHTNSSLKIYRFYIL